MASRNMPNLPNKLVQPMKHMTITAEAPALSATAQTHDEIYERMQQRLYYKTGLWFFSADTGLGKTTGFQIGMKKMWDNVHQTIPFLVLVPTRKDAEIMFKRMEEIEEGCAGVWTQVHDPSDATKADWTPAAKFTKEQAKKKKCLILTHNAGKAAEDWVGRRDVVLIDEYPQPVKTGSVEPWQFTRARDEEAKYGPLGDPFKRAAEWAEEQGGRGLKPVGVPAWVPEVLAVSPVLEAGHEIKLLAWHIQNGTAFQRSWKSTSWVWYDYDLPFEEKAIVFSATALTEGWTFDPMSRGPIKKDGIRVDYKNVTAKLVGWPEGVSKYHKTILSDYRQREAFLDYLADGVGFADDKTLIVCPKDLESDIAKRIPDAKVTHWGCDVGSNEYRDCSNVWLVSLFHQPKNVLYATYLGHSKALATEDTLKKGQSVGTGSFIKRLDYLHHSTQVKQMGARGTCRYVDDTGIANQMTLNCMFDSDLFSTIVPKQFPNCQMVYPKGCKAVYGSKGTHRPLVTKIVEYLVGAKGEFVSASELANARIIIKGATRKKRISDDKDVFDGMGWVFEEGSTGGGRGNKSGFRRKG